jgi:(p)ppGpp synthase/HD superfamily hydrolase
MDILVETAKTRLYTPSEIELLKEAYVIAEKFCKNRYRFRDPKRPFMDHLVETCKILMYSNVNIETVVAGLLHSVKPLAPIYELNAKIGDIVFNYFDTSLAPVKSIPYDRLSDVQWAVLSIQIANEYEMYKSGEIK